MTYYISEKYSYDKSTNLPYTPHIPPEEMIGQKVVTRKTVCSIKTFGIWWYKKHEFQNTFHQPFGRYGNPDM